MIQVILIGVLSAFLTHFINYCIGKPGSEFSPYEIFSGYTVWLSKRRLKWMLIYDQYEKQLNENVRRCEDYYEQIQIKNDFKKILYNAAEPFFTWERAVGMCQVCTGFWVSLISGIFFTQNLLSLLIIVLISHITIRLLNKIL